MKSILAHSMAGVCLVALASPAQAAAQPADTQPAGQASGAPTAEQATDAQAAEATAAPDAAANEDDQTLVVTGTLIRRTAVVGAQTISVDAQAITDKGAFSTNELLGLIPQITNTFNGRFEGDPRGYQAGISITRPNLRNLPSANTTSGALTLVLVNGMRPTPVGVNQASVDVDIIPAAVLAGIDVVTDGGTSLYGADAVAGVINFRTLRTFDGVRLDGNFGFGTTLSNYDTWDASVTAGTSWSGGNAYISAGHSERDGILNGETNFATGLVYNAAGVPTFTQTQCPNPVGTQTRWFRFGPGAAQFTNNPAAPGAGVFPVGTPCDGTAATSFVPRQERSNVYAVLSHAFGDNVDLRVTGYWTKRETELANFPRGFTSAGSPITTGAQVGAAFPGAAVGSITVIPGGTGFSFVVNPAYIEVPTRVGFETWGITPELTVELGSDWQVRTSGHFGRSTNFQSFPGVDTVKAQCYITGCPGIAAGQLNPLNAGAASAAVVTDILNYENAQDTRQQLITVRSIADGPLFSLPAGEVRLAAGVEYAENMAESRLIAGPVGALDSLPYRRSTRHSVSGFAELSVPVFSFLDVSGSVRYDDYSDFGSTTNPNIGFTFKPTSWIRVFGHWNTSFNAPTAIDNLTIGTGRFVCGIYVPGSVIPAQRPTDPLGRDTSRQGSCAMVLQGSGPNLRPQTAESWAIGFEATPPGSGVRFGGEFYSIDVDNALGTVSPSILSTYSTNPESYTYNVTAAQYAALLATLTNGAALGAQQPSSNIAIIVDTRTSNLNAASIEGFDFHATYDTDTSIGHFTLGVSGTWQTKAFITNGGVSSDRLGISVPRLFAVTNLAWNHGPMSARVTVNYSGNFRDEALNNLGQVESVDAFVVTNLVLGYNFEDMGGPLSGTSLRLGVDNIFGESPQIIRRPNTNNPTYNNWTLGTVFKVGATVRF